MIGGNVKATLRVSQIRNACRIGQTHDTKPNQLHFAIKKSLPPDLARVSSSFRHALLGVIGGLTRVALTGTADFAGSHKQQRR